MSKVITGVIVFIIGLVAVSFILPWSRIHWGQVSFAPAQTVTVTGEGKTQTSTQIASFTAGVTAINDDKQTAVDEVNQKVDSLIQSVKDFGIKEADIKTQNLSVYQQEDMVPVEGRQRSTPGQWRVSNDVTITLRQVDQTSALVDLLTASGATNVYGPNFTVDDTSDAEVGLVDAAMDDAQQKAQAIAKASGKSLGSVLQVTEAGTGSPVYPLMARDMGGGGGAPVEPGSQTVQKSLTVTFALK